jgi:hypothetical protein
LIGIPFPFLQYCRVTALAQEETTMPRLRYGFLFPVLPLLAIFPLFFVGWGQGPADPLRQLDNLAHLAYFALMAWALTLLPQVTRRKLSLQFILPLSAVFAMGGAIELIQPRFGRTASWSDLGLDLMGALLGLLFFAAGRRLLNRRLLAVGQLAALALAGYALAGPAATLWDMEQASRSFPILGDFESRFEAGRWVQGTIDHTLARHGSGSLRVDLSTALYSGTALIRSIGDWRGYTTFALSIYNPGPGPLRIIISIRDQEHERRGGHYHDRFNRTFHLKPGWNDLRIPVAEIEKAPRERTMDMSRLREIGIFAANLPTPRVIHLDNLRLLP